MAHVVDHAAAAHERRHGLEEVAPGPQHADPGGPEHLVGAEGQEVTAEAAHVGGDVRNRLGAVGEHQRAGSVRGVGEPGERCDRPEHVRHGGAGHELHAVDEAVEVGEVEAVVVVDVEPAQFDAALLGQHQPRDDVGVMLHLGQQDGVALAQIRPGPGGGDQVDRFRGVLGEDDLVLGSGAPMKRPTAIRADS